MTLWVESTEARDRWTRLAATGGFSNRSEMLRVLVDRFERELGSSSRARRESGELQELLGELHACRFQVKQAGNLLNQQVWLIRSHRVRTLEGRDEVIENLARGYEALKAVLDGLAREIRETAR